MIVIISEILTSDEVCQFRELLASAEWRDGAETAGHIAARAKNNHQLREDHPLATQLADTLIDRLRRNGRFVSAALPLRILPPRFNRYGVGETYADHIDSAIFNIPGQTERIRGDVSSTLFLNDPTDYDGGELVFHNGDIPRAIKLPAGHMVVYPADTIHRVMPITRGTRLASFFWTQSLIRETHRRRMLFNLDSAIQSLLSSSPDAPEIVSLAGLYHNLLRDWSNT